MIVDYVKNLWRYKGISERLDRTMDFLMTCDPASLESRTVLDGENAYVNKQIAALCPEKDGRWESHFRYLDIHVAVDGTHTVGCLNNADGMNWTVVNEKEDYEISDDTFAACKAELLPGMCAIVWPGEPHKPSIGQGKCLKLVAKVKMKD